MRNGELSIFLYSVACQVEHFLLKKPQQPMRKHNANSIPGEESASSSFSTCQPRNRSTPTRRQTHLLPTTTTFTLCMFLSINHQGGATITITFSSLFHHELPHSLLPRCHQPPPSSSYFNPEHHQQNRGYCHLRH